ncbi:MAG: hypothetical protein KAT62_13090 [Desulfuromonadales bacterium]|nr:hypothetical protein [Desulfuromonadales bacterium]
MKSIWKKLHLKNHVADFFFQCFLTVKNGKTNHLYAIADISRLNGDFLVRSAGRVSAILRATAVFPAAFRRLDN